LVKSLRGLPGRSGLPLVIVDDQMATPMRALTIGLSTTPADIARLAAMPPEQWSVPTGAVGAVDRPVASPVPPTPAAVPGPGTGIILVVDDNEVNRNMMQLQARAAGLPIETCTDGAEAVARVAAGGIRLVLMDCMMPVMDGYEATRAIRRAEAGSTRHLPIIAVTAHAFEDNRRQCQEAGMDDFLTKPISQESLLTAIQRWLGTGSPPAPAPVVATATAPPVFDPQPIRQVEAQSPGIGCQLLGILSADLAPAGDAFRNHLSAAAWGPLAQAAHKLRGTSGSLGAMELFQACSDLEQAARHGDPAACARTVAAAIDAIARLQPLLSDYLSNPPKG
jgi:CheY-like chemotaxis protein/HPt (histidine-containing phosphotransfer) domain-containing protein